MKIDPDEKKRIIYQLEMIKIITSGDPGDLLIEEHINEIKKELNCGEETGTS